LYFPGNKNNNTAVGEILKKNCDKREANLQCLLLMSGSRREEKTKQKGKEKTAAASQTERKATALILWPAAGRTHRN